MSEKLVQHGDIIVRELGALRRITLNRPQAFNALTLEMAVTMMDFLRAWAADAAVGSVLIDGAGDRGLCSGGDLRALYDAAKTKSPFPAQYWATEYQLDVLIARYPKPVIAIMDGLVMGGGVGISAHAAHRIVTERSAVAMPECAIGLFPDVGASFILARAPGLIGTHLALTGTRMTAADAIYAGFADIHIAAARHGDLRSALAEAHGAAGVRATLNAMSTPPAPGLLATARPWIDRCYAANRIEEIVDLLKHDTAVDALAALNAVGKGSPTSLKVTLRNLREAAGFARVEECFRQDYRIVLACIAGHDFIEGIRATIVDKDRKPAWQPDRLEDVTPDIVDRHFRALGELELNFDH
ncbi:MAG TPA: enoyl-CoA hydratase/isomerase family protein [Xanthobacteraceae bacterium]|nr:enoyl-CoA hydratase/isomerase family protein [Xanthobacteraceae bacterium]